MYKIVSFIHTPLATLTLSEPVGSDVQSVSNLTKKYTRFRMDGVSTDTCFLGGEKFIYRDGSTVTVHSHKEPKSIGSGTYGNVRHSGMLVTGSLVEKYQSLPGAKMAAQSGNSSSAVYFISLATKKIELQRINLANESYSIQRIGSRDVIVLHKEPVFQTKPLAHENVASEAFFLKKERGLENWAPQLFHFENIAYKGQLHGIIDDRSYPIYVQNGAFLVPLMGEKMQISQTLLRGKDCFDWGDLVRKSSHPKSASEKTRFVLQLFAAVIKCHQNGIAHKDIKPENIWIDENGNLLLLDFGTSALVTDEARLQKRVGTKNYVAPEIVSKAKVPRGLPVDWYAVAVTSLVVWIGVSILSKCCVPTENYMDRIRRLNAELSRLADCPSDLVTLLKGCLAEDPAQRPTAWDVLSAVKASLQLGPLFFELVNAQDPDWVRKL